MGKKVSPHSIRIGITRKWDSSWYAKGKQYKQYNFDQIGISLLRQLVQKQKAANLSNKYKNIKIIREGIAELIQ